MFLWRWFCIRTENCMHILARKMFKYIVSKIFRAFKVARYSYHKNPAQESRTQNRVTIFTRRSRKLINKMKELPKWPDVSSCSRHITPFRVFYSVLCRLLTSLEFSILEKQCALSLYFVWWPMFKFCMLYCTTKNFHYTKNKKFCNAKKILPKNMTFSHFPKKWDYRIF
jgi:hypothetical protein